VPKKYCFAQPTVEFAHHGFHDLIGLSGLSGLSDKSGDVLNYYFLII